MTGQSETKHTPGELRVGYSDGSGPECLTVDDDTVIVMGGDSFGLMYGVRKPDDAARIVLTWNCHDELVAALRRADEFIRNGIELGFIHMPEVSTPDPAHETPGIIAAALAKAGA